MKLTNKPVAPTLHNKVRKGDIVAIRLTRSSTRINGATERHLVWTLAQVHKASRAGEAMLLLLPGSCAPRSKRDLRIEDVFTIAKDPYQQQAHNLYATASLCGDFETVDQLQEAIKATPAN